MSGPGGRGNCPVYGSAGHQHVQSGDNEATCACGDKVTLHPKNP